MFANLIPLPGGVGGVDAGLIGAFALFDLGLGSATLFASRSHLPPDRLLAAARARIIAFFQLRTTVRRWEACATPGPSVGSEIAESLPGATIAESKV